ncbi:hypothetical protein [Neobacillus sp. D3-1R]|uniref:hypothetical protein n=1 Tax=Neobacillus sp. D3-1R TaxID=3445778 RepID=UPI003F9F70A6
MNKRSVRAFSLGIILAVSLLGWFYFNLDQKPKEKNLTVQDAKKMLESENYLIFSSKEYEADKAKTIADTIEKNKQEWKQSTKEAKKEPATQKTTIRYHLEVVSGMTSNDIVDRLYEAEIIKDPDEFQHFLDDHQYSTKIQLGVFEVTSDMSLEQIAKIITKS